MFKSQSYFPRGQKSDKVLNTNHFFSISFRNETVMETQRKTIYFLNMKNCQSTLDKLYDDGVFIYSVKEWKIPKDKTYDEYLNRFDLDSIHKELLFECSI